VYTLKGTGVANEILYLKRRVLLLSQGDQAVEHN